MTRYDFICVNQVLFSYFIFHSVTILSEVDETQISLATKVTMVSNPKTQIGGYVSKPLIDDLSKSADIPEVLTLCRKSSQSI